jgi:glucokinase
MEKVIVGVDLGGTNIKAGLVSQDGKVLYRTKIATEGKQGPEKVADRIAKVALDCAGHATGGKKNVLGVGIGSPGPLDMKNGVVVVAPNLPGWVNIPLRSMIEKRTGLPCTLENDANAAGLAEQWVGAGKGSDSVVIFTLGTGIGGGIVLNGKVWHGFSDVAGEIGHMSIHPDSPDCNCGSKGCIEAYASATAMVRRMRETIAKGVKTSLAEKKDSLTSKDIYEAALAGDEAACENMRMTGFYLGVAIVNILHVLNPEVVVMSGGVAAAGDLLMKPIKEVVETRAMEACRKGVKICWAVLGDDAGVIGAARSFVLLSGG